MQCACAILSSVSCAALEYFSTYSHKRHDFRKRGLDYKMCVLIFSTTFVRNIWYYKENIARYDQKNVYWASCKVSVILVRFQWNLNFPDTFSNNTTVLNFMKIRVVEAELFHANGRRHGRTDRQTSRWTDGMKLIVAFRNFVKASKKRW